MGVSQKEEQEMISALVPFLSELNKVSGQGTGIPGVSINSTSELKNLLTPRVDDAMRQHQYVQKQLPDEDGNFPQKIPAQRASEIPQVQSTTNTKARMSLEQKKPLPKRKTTAADADILSDLDDTTSIDRELLKEKLKEMHFLLKEIYEIIR